MAPRGHEIWFRVTQHGGTDASIDPSTRTSSFDGSYGRPDWGEYRGALGALWWYDWPSGTLNWEEGANMPAHGIQVTQTQPESGGPCLTSITVGSRSLWLTAAAGNPVGGVCVR
jgi:hypothetical protein